MTGGGFVLSAFLLLTNDGLPRKRHIRQSQPLFGVVTDLQRDRIVGRVDTSTENGLLVDFDEYSHRNGVHRVNGSSRNGNTGSNGNEKLLQQAFESVTTRTKNRMCSAKPNMQIEVDDRHDDVLEAIQNHFYSSSVNGVNGQGGNENNGSNGPAENSKQKPNRPRANVQLPPGRGKTLLALQLVPKQTPQQSKSSSSTDSDLCDTLSQAGGPST